MDVFDVRDDDDEAHDGGVNEMQRLFSMLLDDENNEDLLGDEIDIDLLLAQELTQEEERQYALWKVEKDRIEEEDRRLAEQLALQRSNEGIQEGRVPTGEPDADLAYALALEEEERKAAKSMKKAPPHDPDMLHAMAIVIEEEERERERIAAMEAESLRLAQELAAADHGIESDAEIAKRLQDEWNAPPPQPPPIKYNPPPPPPPPPVDLSGSGDGYLGESHSNYHRVAIPGDDSKLTNSFEGLINEYGVYLENNLAQLRFYVKSLGGNCSVKPVLKGALSERWLACKEEFTKKYGENDQRSQSTVCFHGTKVKHLTSIENGGLKVPGLGTGVKHENDSGWWGKGIYVSPIASYSSGYAEGGKLIVCSVLRGRVYVCTQRMDGKPGMKGYDSHEAEAGQEYVLFRNEQVIPLFVVSREKKWGGKHLVEKPSHNQAPGNNSMSAQGGNNDGSSNTLPKSKFDSIKSWFWKK